jgi:hypothetical protein
MSGLAQATTALSTHPPRIALSRGWVRPSGHPLFKSYIKQRRDKTKKNLLVPKGTLSSILPSPRFIKCRRVNKQGSKQHFQNTLLYLFAQLLKTRQVALWRLLQSKVQNKLNWQLLLRSKCQRPQNRLHLVRNALGRQCGGLREQIITLGFNTCPRQSSKVVCVQLICMVIHSLIQGQQNLGLLSEEANSNTVEESKDIIMASSCDAL